MTLIRIIHCRYVTNTLRICGFLVQENFLKKMRYCSCCVQVLHGCNLLSFLHMQPEDQPTIIVVILCQNKGTAVLYLHEYKSALYKTAPLHSL